MATVAGGVPVLEHRSALTRRCVAFAVHREQPGHAIIDHDLLAAVVLMKEVWNPSCDFGRAP
jgi:hypothetical protein